MASTILATLLANDFRDVSSRAAMEKSVSPQPPMATKILVPVVKAWRAESTLRSLGHSLRFESRNRPDRMKARATWVIGLIRVSSRGITSCCLPNISAIVPQALCMEDDGCYPVRYIKQMGSPLLAMLQVIRPATSHTRAAPGRRVKKCIAPALMCSTH